jgi:hypothetical protein
MAPGHQFNRKRGLVDIDYLARAPAQPRLAPKKSHRPKHKLVTGHI